jgi:hypothetical protein
MLFSPIASQRGLLKHEINKTVVDQRYLEVANKRCVLWNLHWWQFFSLNNIFPLGHPWPPFTEKLDQLACQITTLSRRVDIQNDVIAELSAHNTSLIANNAALRANNVALRANNAALGAYNAGRDARLSILEDDNQVIWGAIDRVRTFCHHFKN